MKNIFKKYLSALLAVVMLLSAAPFGTVSYAWNPSVDDGFNLNFSTKLFKQIDGEWVEADIVEPGDEIKARVYIGTDYYAGTGEVVVFYNNSFFEDDYSSNTTMNLVVNDDPESSTAIYGITGNFLKGKGIANMLVNEGYITSEFAQAHSAITFGYLYPGKGTCQILNDEHWFAEFDLRVRQDAVGTGDFMIVEDTVLDPDEHEYAYVNIAKGQQGESPNNAFSMYLWEANVSIDNARISVPVRYSDYTVETYTMGTDGEYELSSKTFEAETGSAVDAEYTVEEGFELNTEKSIPSGVVAKDNLLVLKVYLDRKTYSVTFDDGENKHTFNYLYGQEIEIPEIIPEKDGYIFIGWSTDGTTVLENLGETNIEGKDFYPVWVCDHISETVTTPPSCTEDGSEYTVCSRCGEPLSESTILPSNGHTPADEWETVTEPTLTTEGKKIKRCIVCGETAEEAAISMLKTATDESCGITVEYAPDDYIGNVGISVDKPSDKNTENLINNEIGMGNSTVYDIAITVDGSETSPKNSVTVKLPLPEGYDSNRSCVYEINTESGTIKDIDAEYRDGYFVFETDSLGSYVIFEEYDGVLKIRKPSQTTIKYGDAIILHADLSEPLPEGAYIKWTADNGNFTYTASKDGSTCQITPSKTGNATFTATVYDSSGNEIQSATQTMTSKAGFFQKIGAFFKRLFGLTKIFTEAIKFIV